jgi:hypothetical protein
LLSWTTSWFRMSRLDLHFSLSFLQYALDKDVHHVNALSKLGDV